MNPPIAPCQAAASSLVQQADVAHTQLVKAVAALPTIVKGHDKGTQLLALLCAAAVVATACTGEGADLLQLLFDKTECAPPALCAPDWR